MSYFADCECSKCREHFGTAILRELLACYVSEPPPEATHRVEWVKKWRSLWERAEAHLAGVRVGPKLPEIIRVLAEWEDRNGTLAAIMADEWAALREAITTAAVTESPRMVRNACGVEGKTNG